ncbi:polysaccharide biosynthesis tyrosine autokinase [Paenirhodobacter sp. CAU 1674]|uniref:polysaccharide biosynthesis tyrosine autokinase n=1 Tax=Paenirhodobacter sp. CAU 1674 TaxID=3032596 RepID=UPI0023D9869E|nr:polysaccharide biosynthesis tyrosine autokinase [Paenirhodobacter sp. CAU 1674]MDF2143185.1 polysaccharide biosynthesis tyrosine autokinase [Paenirhodobacter sp. CAU 1674]
MKHISPTHPAQRERGDDDVIDLGQILHSLRAGWRVIAASFSALVGLGLVYLLLIATPVYTAKSVVMLETRQAQVVDFEGALSGLTGESGELNTEIEVIRSRELLSKVVDELDLTADPEFNARLRSPSFLARVRGIFSSATPEPSAEQVKSSVVNELLEALSARNIPSSYVFEIAVSSVDPQKAATIADAVARRYILNQIEAKFQATEQATSWLANRVGELKAELEAAEEKVKQFNAQTSLVSVEMLATLEVQLKDLRERATQMAASEKAAQARLEALEAAQSQSEKIAAAQDEGLNRLAGADAAAGGETFDQRYERIVARAKLELARASDQKQALERSLQALETQIASQGNDMIQLQQLTREAEASRMLYEYFLSRMKETSAQQGIQQADSRVISNAVVPVTPTAPRKSLVMAMCGILGLIIGVALVLVREAMHSAYRSARELEEDTGVTVMGQIPVIPGKDRVDILDYLVSKPSSAAMEAIRNLRTSVLLSNVDNPPQVIMSTSSIPGEGKTTNSLALATNLVGTGKSVLLLEGDIRRNTLLEYFPELKGRKGLVSVLSGEAGFDDVVALDPKTGVSILMGQRSTTNAADLFMSDTYMNFIDEMRRRFDYIIIDTPPVLVVPDARIIAKSADAILFTVRWDSTARGQVEAALQMFETVNQRVTGIVLSQIDSEEMKRYGYGGKYGRYGSYGAYGGNYYTE